MHNNDVFNLFLAYRPIFYQVKWFDSGFGLSSLWLRMEESALIFAAYEYDMGKTCESPPYPPYRGIVTDVCREY